MLSIFLLAVFSLAQALPSCLHLRSHCLRNPRCSAYFASFENTCGYSLTRCAASSPSDCVRDLRAIRDLLSASSCVCYRAIGFHEECDFFRQLIWNHPCERLLLDAGNERSLEERGPTPAPGVKRTTRTPAADHVQELVAQLGGELETKSLLERATCNEALDQVCMRHVSCRQLWQLFRSECGVNQDNKCTMRDPEVCWQSFEGLSWSGLGNCRCDSSNSDCHWIRLLTNYNKCIYEISLTRTGSREDEKDRKAELYRRRFETNLGDQRRLEEATKRQQEEERRRREEEEAGRKEEERRRKEEEEQRKRDEAAERRRKEEDERLRRAEEENERKRKEEQRRREEEDRLRKEEEERQRREEKEKRRQEEMRLRKEEQMRKEEERRKAKEEERKRQDEEARRKEALNRDLGPSWRSPPVSQVRATPSTSISVVRKPPERNGLRATINERATPPTWWDKQKEENTYYRPLFEAPTPPPGYYKYTTASTQFDTQLQTTRRPSQIPPTTRRPSLRPAPPPTTPRSSPVHPTQRAVALSTRAPFDSSSCPEAMARCEAADECRWHLGELRARCSRSSCRRDDCASALQRFSRYVPIELAETVMFCQCSAGDEDCLRSQELFYPPCLYSSQTSLATCSHTFGRCAADVRCRSLQDQLRSNCPLSGADCVGRSLANCRRVLLAARGSILEQPCFCPLSDVSCIAKQRMMIPHNPCIEKAMRDLAEPTRETAAVVRKEEGQSGGSWGDEAVPAALAVAPVAAVAAVAAGKDHRRKEDHRKHHKVTTSTTTSTTTTTPETVVAEARPTKSRYRTTAKPPPATEAPPPWETTTTSAPTTTTTFVTQPPPPAEGCQARDASGRNVFFPLGTVMRRYVDWSSRCSSWCECVQEELLSCERLPCLEDGACEAPLTSIEFGERIFLKGRGACFCESSQFICELPTEMPELYPGLYVAAAYSQPDVDLLRKEVPSAVLERAGFLSADPGKDIGSRLQVAFERMLPEWIQCRLVLMSELSEAGHAFFRVEWWGQDERFNHTRVQWQHGGAEKVCSPSVARLSDLFANSDSLRYQLVLSTIKQLKVLDYLDGIPSPSSLKSLSLVLAALWLLF